jgi:amidohydrolase
VMMHQLLQQIKLSPMIPYSIKITRFETGNDNLNIIPGTALFGIDARAQTNDDLHIIKEQLQQTFSLMESIFSIKIQHEQHPDTPASIISKQAVRFMEKAILDTMGLEALSPTVVTPGSDDFHFYTKLRPSIKATMLALGADLTPGLHHPNMTFDRSCMMHGVEILTRTILHTIKAESHS